MLLSVSQYKVGALIDIVYSDTGRKDDAGPFIKTNHSLIDRTGSNWHLGECMNLLAEEANPKRSTFWQLNEFRLQILNGEIKL